MRRMKKILFLYILICSTPFLSIAGNIITINSTIKWSEKINVYQPTPEDVARPYWKFEGATYRTPNPSLPWVSEVVNLSSYGTLNVTLQNAVYVPIDMSSYKSLDGVSADINLQHEVQLARKDAIANVRFVPIRRSGNGYEKLISYTLIIELFEEEVPVKATGIISERGGPTTNSVLKDGDIYKIAIDRTGVFKLDYNFLKTTLKIDIDKINPKNIQLFGNGGGMLPERIATARYDDVSENAIEIIGESDGKFDSQDYILFYATATDKWSFDVANKTFTMAKNIYDDRSYYFLKIGSNAGKRLNASDNIVSTDYKSAEFDDYQHFEEDKVNLLNYNNPTQGTGKQWFGDKFSFGKKEISYIGKFNFPNIITSENAAIRGVFASRSANSSNCDVLFDGNTAPLYFSNVQVSQVESLYAQKESLSERFKPTKDNIDVTIKSNGTADFEAWIDYLEVQVRRKLFMSGGQMPFRDTKTMPFETSTYTIGGMSANQLVWDVTNPVEATKINGVLAADKYSFGTATKDKLNEYISFSADAAYKPVFVEKMANQNLHAIKDIDLLVVYHPDFEADALRLVAHRKAYSKLNVAAAPIATIYNEYSSGAIDPTAIRDFAKNLYDQSTKFAYLLLVGDGSFNYKNIGVVAGNKNKNFIPVYETDESLDPISGFPSDDYYALLSGNEGVNLNGGLDIGVGRLAVNSKAEAKTTIDKIIRYDTDKLSLGDYRNRITFIADDEDSNTHIAQADKLSDELSIKYKNFNSDKIYIDAYPQLSTPGGQRCPDANQGMNNNIFNGTLVMNYIGHGGSTGWSQERILIANQDVPTWNNKERMPLIITATCSFAGYDDAERVTAGEQILLKENGGAIALYSTTRAVYSSENERLTDAVFNEIFVKDSKGFGRTFGEILRNGKNKSGVAENNRKFTLLGDPSQRLALPLYDIRTTAINGKAVAIGQPDTIKALQKVTIQGAVLDAQGNVLTSFNGKVFPSIYDKTVKLKTLGQDNTAQFDFKIQKNILFRGTATVKNGIFSFSCVLPKDINYEFGYGKISYYAENGIEDASGNDETSLVIGGTFGLAKDDLPPKIKIFMNNENFIRGGLTNQNPTLLVKLSDDIGLNVSGTSVGHDFTAILDNNPQNTYRLNNFYEAATDDPTQGMAKFPLARLATGTHTIKVKAWDVANNSAENETEFVVENSASAALEHILNYPNPFTTSTNFQFDHNLSAPTLNVQIKIYTIAGRLVKVIEEQVTNTGRSQVHWDGRDESGDDLAKGVYLYKLNVKEDSETGKKVESDFEKLVILK